MIMFHVNLQGCSWAVEPSVLLFEHVLQHWEKRYDTRRWVRVLNVLGFLWLEESFATQGFRLDASTKMTQKRGHKWVVWFGTNKKKVRNQEHCHPTKKLTYLTLRKKTSSTCAFYRDFWDSLHQLPFGGPGRERLRWTLTRYMVATMCCQTPQNLTFSNKRPYYNKNHYWLKNLLDANNFKQTKPSSASHPFGDLAHSW